MAMAMAMADVASVIGVSPAVFQFLVAFIGSIPCSLLWRFIPSPSLRHCYAALSGCYLSYLAFSPLSVIHFIPPMLLGYGSMAYARQYCGLFTFVAAFSFLIACHVYYMSGDAWKDGGIDCTGALMVLTLKVISAAMNYQDGLLKEEELRPAQKKYRILHLPSFIEYAGFCLCCGTHLAGPVYELQDYLDWTAEKGAWSQKLLPSPYGGASRAFLQAILSMGLYTYLTPRFSVSRIFEPQYKSWGFWARLGYQWLAGFTVRWKYYFIWSLAETSVIISGFGFSGWSESCPGKPKWDRARNVDIIGVELAETSAVLPLVWNIHVSTWLRLYVYDRLSKKGRKPGLSELLLTQIVSAVWHGLYAGYILFFVHSALMIAGSRVIYRWQQAIRGSSWILNKIVQLGSLSYTILVLNYACIGFVVLNLDQTLESYQSVYYVGTILSMALIILGSVIKPPKSTGIKAKNN